MRPSTTVSTLVREILETISTELCGGLLEHGVERVGRLVGLESFLDAGRGVEPLLKTREARLELLAGVECFGKLHQDLLS